MYVCVCVCVCVTYHEFINNLRENIKTNFIFFLFHKTSINLNVILGHRFFSNYYLKIASFIKE